MGNSSSGSSNAASSNTTRQQHVLQAQRTGVLSLKGLNLKKVRYTYISYSRLDAHRCAYDAVGGLCTGGI